MGCATAYHLAREGDWRVVLLDAPGVGRMPSATRSSAGILSYPGWDRWDLGVVRESAGEYRWVSEHTGRGGFRAEGGIRVTRHEAGERWLKRALRALDTARINAQMLHGAEIDRAVGIPCRDELRAGLFVPTDATFSPTEIATAYAQAARDRGAELIAVPSPPRIRPTDNGWRIDAAGRTFDSERLVVTCGAWTKRVMASLGQPLPLAPFRTQACILRPYPLTSPFPSVHDLDVNAYVRPFERGRVLAGNGTDPCEVNPDSSDPTADHSFREHMVGVAGSLAPVHEPGTVEAAWAGVCLASPDRYPLVGPVPEARGLYVAAGFNGFGAMRAGGLARRLVIGMRTNVWGLLRPADPRRFRGVPASFDPHPEFPLEGPEGANLSTGPEEEEEAVDPPAFPRDEHDPTYRAISTPDEIGGLRIPPLSEWFDPFLRYFLRDALRSGGMAEVAEFRGTALGIYLEGGGEGIGSIFTRIRNVAEGFRARHRGHAVYTEDRWWPSGAAVTVLAADLRDWTPPGAPQNPIRIASPDDLPALCRFAEEFGGPGGGTWFVAAPPREETCFLAEHGGRVVGMSWVTTVGPYARGHSFLVHPRFRGVGIGTDLLRARMEWLRSLGARQVVSEIYDGNRASFIAAERAGMACVSEMFHYAAAPAA